MVLSAVLFRRMVTSEQMYFDSFLKLASLPREKALRRPSRPQEISKKMHLTFVLSVSEDASNLPECAKSERQSFSL